MSNKYRAQSRAAQRARKLAHQCTDKRRYDSRDEAEQKGQDVYPCPHCHGRHRTGQAASLAAELKRRRKHHLEP